MRSPATNDLTNVGTLAQVDGSGGTMDGGLWLAGWFSVREKRHGEVEKEIEGKKRDCLFRI